MARRWGSYQVRPGAVDSYQLGQCSLGNNITQLQSGHSTNILMLLCCLVVVVISIGDVTVVIVFVVVVDNK